MNHKQGTDRNQMKMFCMESSIAQDSFFRVVDVFVEAIDLKSFGFAHVLTLSAEAGDEGANALMSDYIRLQEKLVWMYSSFLNK
jgi:starvation-inducible DNA-binding protein